MARHARATQVSIELRVEDARLCLRVRDDGCGFEPSRGGAGVGLLSMRERATALGGSLRIAALAGGGTEIEVTLALPEAAPEGVPT